MKRKFGFSVVFLILSFYMVSSKFSLKEFTTSDLILFLIILTGSFFVMLSTIEDLKEFSAKPNSNKILVIFNLLSSVTFLLTGFIFLVLRIMN